MIAAHRGGIDTVLIPKENEKDLKDIPAQIKRNVKIMMVDHMDEVLGSALALEDAEAFLREGDHAIENIFELPAHGAPGEDLSTPAGVN
jgi:ATP-dependent Lon protease